MQPLSQGLEGKGDQGNLGHEVVIKLWRRRQFNTLKASWNGCNNSRKKGEEKNQIILNLHCDSNELCVQ